MLRRELIVSIVVVLTALVGVLVWAALPGRREASAREFPSEPIAQPTLHVSSEERADLLRRARVWIPNPRRPAMPLTATPDASSTLSTGRVECRYVPEPSHGTTTKFTCMLQTGEAIKVKYGATLEKQAEVAASRLLLHLGFLADHMFLVPVVRCYGCPHRPFESTWVADRLHIDLIGTSPPDRYVDFRDVAVERRFAGRAIETDNLEGWGWYELDTPDRDAGASTAEIDALKLAAVLLAHWDNKAENQRLICRDGDPGEAGVRTQRCSEPWAMIHDLGSTFGPNKADFDAWNKLPIWTDARACTVSMQGLPYGGGTFRDAIISEPGRQLLVSELDALSRTDVRAWLEAASFETPERWTASFLEKVRQIKSAGPCPAPRATKSSAESPGRRATNQKRYK